MGNYSVVKVDEIEGAYGGVFKSVRAALGASALGINVLELPAGFAEHPEHDHLGDGQEEIYTALAGSAELEIDGERVPLESGTFIRVAPGAKRKIYPGPDGVSVLAVGGVPGAAYVPRS